MMTVTIGILVLQWSILSFRTVLDGIWHRFEQRLIPEPLELVLSWALSSSCAPQQDCTSNLNPHSCQGTCSLQGMIKAEHSGCCFLVPGQFSKAGAPEAALRRVGDKQWKTGFMSPPHTSPQAQAQPSSRSPASGKKKPRKGAGAFLLLQSLWSLQDLGCVWGGDPRGDDPTVVCPWCYWSHPCCLAVFVSPFMFHTNPRIV